MTYEDIMWGPSMRGYLTDNKARIRRCEKSLASLKNQDGEFARDHRMLLEVFRDIEALLLRHIKTADSSALHPPDVGTGKEP